MCMYIQEIFINGFFLLNMFVHTNNITQCCQFENSARSAVCDSSHFLRGSTIYQKYT